MGVYINVNLDSLKSAEAELEKYVGRRKTIINHMNDQMENLPMVFLGEDSKAYQTKWNSLSAADGALTIVKDNIDNVHQIIAAAYQLYSEAQRQSVEQASKLK